MFNTAPISQLVDELPQRSLTTITLKALDFVVPGQWEPSPKFAELVQKISQETRVGRLEAIATHADQLYSGDLHRCQKAVWLYQTADSTDTLLSAAALAHQVGEKIGLLSFLGKVTPKDETLQSIDLAVKLSVEALAFLLIHGLPHQDSSKFAESLHLANNETSMRMAALVCLDGILPLGPEFLSKIQSTLSALAPSHLEANPIYAKISPLLPDGSTLERLSFIRNIFEQSQGWMQKLQSASSLSPTALVGRLNGFLDINEGSFDILAAFLDATTNYFSYTGTQSVARYVVLKSAQRFNPSLV